MSDLRTRLERIGDRARPASDAFARFEGLRHRRERNRRISAGVVAFVVAAAGSVGIFSLVGDDEPNVLGGGEGELLALWPESTLDAALAAQDAVEAGDPAVQWRLNPEETAHRFVADALGWPETPEELSLSSTTSPDGVVTVDIVKGVDPGPCQRPECAGRDVIVSLRQLLPGSGTWSVVAAQSSVFNIALHPEEEVEVGAEIRVASGFEDGTEVAVGFAGTGSCSAFHEETVEVRDLALAAVVPDALAGCTGYVYALTPSTPLGQVELGRIMFVYSEPKPALDYTVAAITAVPVTFVDPAGTSPEPVPLGRIACDGANPIVETPIVATQPDGVHVEVSNPTEQTISFTIGPDIAAPDGALSSLSPGTVDLVLTNAPGPMSFACSPPPEEGQAGVSGLGSFEVVDPGGNYVPADLACDTGSAYGSGAAQPAEAVGEQGDPIDVARGHLNGLEAGDVVEVGGYRGASSPVMRIVRDGKVVGTMTLTDDMQGGWLLGSVEGCGGTSFGWDDSGSASSRFPACPALEGALAPDPDADAEARAVAEQFVAASRSGDRAAVVGLTDPSVLDAAGTLDAGGAGAVTILGSGPATGDVIVAGGCGQDVADRTWFIVVDDGSDSASLDFNLYLIRREDGWKVWGLY
jgi:hypothetical protein